MIHRFHTTNMYLAWYFVILHKALGFNNVYDLIGIYVYILIKENVIIHSKIM